MIGRHGGKTLVFPMESVAKRARVKFHGGRLLALKRQGGEL